ncbi:hypothetical protein [Actinophytocola sp.]|uniref:hypothetical protein n=1 Tax=Actinophytocola sp. TaxID=1872138 RepID=UPI00389AE26A
MNRFSDINEEFGDVPLESRTAFAEFPELRRLIDLVRAGWQFIPVSSGDELIEVRGLRVWPDEWMDTIVLRYTTDAAGLRCDRSRGVVWEHTGNLPDVVNGLLTLPAPSDPAAPRLVLRTTMRLWTS